MEHRSHASNIVVSVGRKNERDQCVGESSTDVAQPELCKEKQMEGPVNCTDSELSIYLRGLEAGYLATSCSDTNASVPSKSNPIASRSYQQGKQTVVFRGFPYLQMCASSTGDRGEDSLTLCAAGSHARTFQQPDAARESRASGRDSGEKWPASLAKYDHDTCSWRTHQFSLRGDLEPFSETWPRWGLMRGGECWERTMPVLPTFGSGSGSWPTPQASDNRPRATEKSTARRRMLGKQISLEAQVKWPTPCASEGVDCGTNWQSLADCDKGGRIQRAMATRGMVETRQTTHAALNPAWVEWLMGWPIGWTDLQPLATGRFQSAQPLRGASFAEWTETNTNALRSMIQ